MNLQRSKEPRPITRTASVLETPESRENWIRNKKTERTWKQHFGHPKQIIWWKENIGGINAGRDNVSAKNKQLRILENRLDKANQKFNESIAQNKVLCEEINN